MEYGDNTLKAQTLHGIKWHVKISGDIVREMTVNATLGEQQTFLIRRTLDQAKKARPAAKFDFANAEDLTTLAGKLQTGLAEGESIESLLPPVCKSCHGSNSLQCVSCDKLRNVASAAAAQIESRRRKGKNKKRRKKKPNKNKQKSRRSSEKSNDNSFFREMTSEEARKSGLETIEAKRVH